MRVGQSHARTDPGRRRRGNEDAFVCRPPLFAIADGMGGAQAGEVASALAASALRDWRMDGGGPRRVVELIQEANRRVHDRALSDATTSGMGTTMTVALVEPDGTVTFGHVGDSRAYLLREGALDQLTNDHSLVAELVRRGELSPAEAEVHPQRSVITRALGTDPDVDVDAFSVDARPGDLFLICSDGLSDMVDGRTLESILVEHRGDLAAASRALVQAANRAGGEDNITAVLFEVTEGEPPPPDEPDERTKEQVLDREEDTLHGEVRAPDEPRAAVDDTMVVPVEQIHAAMAASAEAGEEAGGQAAAPEAGFGRRMLALLVIVALVVLIVVLVWQGLAR